MYYLKISNYGPLIIDGSHKWNGYMPQSFKIGRQWKTLKKNKRGCRSKRSTQSGNTKKKTKKLDPLILAHQVEFTLRGLKKEKQNKANRKLYTPREDKRSQFEIMKESIVDFHQAFDYVNQEFQNYKTQKRW